MKYYELIINKTAKPMGNKHDWQSYDHERKIFKTIKEVKDYLAEQYYYVKTIKKSYIDDKNGEAKEAGKIYCFKSDPVSYDDVKHYEQHWTEVNRITSESIAI